MRYLRHIVEHEFPNGDVSILRRNKNTKLVDVVVLCKEQSSGNGSDQEFDDSSSRTSQPERRSVQKVQSSKVPSQSVSKAKAIPKVKATKKVVLRT